MSQPRPVETRKKYRPISDIEEELGNTANLMFDARVVRGVTCAQPDDYDATVPLYPTHAPTPQFRRPTKAHLVRTGKIRPTQKTAAEIHDSIVVPKKRVEVPLHLYLIEQSEAVQTHVVDTQTDIFLEEPPAPEYIPRKTGVDIETQVENDEVFNFDRDVAHILEVVISKSCEQSLMEVRQEEEFRYVARQKAFLQEKSRRRDVAASELEKVELELLKNKEQLLSENRQRANREQRLQQKLASNIVAKRYLEPLQQRVFDDLDASHYFYDPVQLNVEKFTPWLTEKLADNLRTVKSSKEWLHRLISDSVDKISMDQDEAYELRRLEEERQKKEEEERILKEREERMKKRNLKLYIKSAELGGESGRIGPVELRADFTVATLEEKVFSLLEASMGEGGGFPSRERISFSINGERVDPTTPLFAVPSLQAIVLVIQPLQEAENQEKEGEEDEAA